MSEDNTQFTRSEFVGRRREVAELCGGLDDARRGHGRFFLVAGAPGIGKTWLADEVARHAASSAMAVLRAGCWEGAGAPPYWPFIQVIRSALGGIERHQEAPPRPSIASSPALAHDLAQLIPSLQLSTAAASEPSPQPSLDPDQARFRLFDSVATAVRDLAAARPLMLIVEDLHDADQPSLLMLRFVVRQLKNSPVMVLCTYRDVAVQHSPVLSQLVGYLTHEGIEVPLLALSREETARLVEERAGMPPSPRLVSDIHQATAGNPLFIDGLVRVLAAEESLSDAVRLNLAAFRVPDGVREAIRRWLALLSDRSALVTAATIGQQFELRCLQRVIQAPGHELVDVLREAANLGIVVPLSHGAYRFSHALIRNALCDELDSAQRSLVHLQIGAALEAIYHPDVDAHLAELAHHFVEGGDIDKAIDYSIRAAEAAQAVFAYEDAATHWQTALELMPERSEDRERRAELLERLGDLLGLTASEGARYLERAAGLYADLGRPEAAARVQARMAISVVGEDVRIEQGLSASQRTIEISEQLGDRVLWARAASSHAYNLCARGQLTQSFALIHRVSEEADRLNDNITGFGITAVCAEMLMWLCDPVGISAQMERELTRSRIIEAPLIREVLMDWLLVFEMPRGNLDNTGRPLGQTRREPLIEAETAFYRGEWEHAELLMVQAFGQARRGGRGRRMHVYSAWLAKVRGALSQHSAAEEILRENVTIGSKRPHLPFELHSRQELALLYAHTGRPELAEPHLERCREVMAAGEDWRGLAGHVGRAEGAVAAAQGRFETAHEQFAAAVEIHRRYQVPFEQAKTLHHWGRALLAASDNVQALDKFDAAMELYRRHGAGERWLKLVHEDRLRAQSPVTVAHRRRHEAQAAEQVERRTVPSVSEPIEQAVISAIFRKQGEYWTLCWAGSQSRLKHRKGMDYIARLLRYPGQEFAAADLTAAIEPGVEC